MRVLIFGASGLLGKYLVREKRSETVVGLNSSDVDVRDAPSVQRVVADERPDWTILAAAYTDVDGCETNQDLAIQTNTVGVVNVAQATRQQGSRLLFLSSDYVFDGTKTTPYETNDVLHPQSIYGKTKAEAERRIVDLLPNACILRTSWVFGIGGRCFPDTILKLAVGRPEIDVVHDQRGCPTYARDLARAIYQLCDKDASGVVHATNAGDCTWFEFADEIIRQAGMPTIVRPTTTETFPRPAPRPRYSVLSPASLPRYGVQMPSWQEAVANYLAERDIQG